MSSQELQVAVSQQQGYSIPGPAQGDDCAFVTGAHATRVSRTSGFRMQIGLVPGNLRDEVKHGGAAFVSVRAIDSASLGRRA